MLASLVIYFSLASSRDSKIMQVAEEFVSSSSKWKTLVPSMENWLHVERIVTVAHLVPLSVNVSCF